MLVLQGKLQAVLFLICKGFDGANIAQRLSSQIAHLGLGLLIGDCERVQEVGTDTRDQNLG